MPKTSKTLLEKMKTFARDSNGILTIQPDIKTNRNVLFCQACLCVVSAEKKSQVVQHIKGANHQRKVNDLKSKQESVQTVIQKTQIDFKSDLCEFMVKCNIPFDRLSKPAFKGFFEKYMKYDIPSDTNLRQYLKPLFMKTIEEIRGKLKDEYIYVQIDETKDIKKRKVVNTIIGSLNSEKNKCFKYLIDVRFVDRANSSTISQTITHALTVLWPEGIKFDNFLVLITDAAMYMKAAGEGLKVTYPKLIHITCVAHGLHNLSEYLMKKFIDVNRFIACAKKIFLKAPNRVELFKEILPNTPLPPEPVKTRWGSWLRGVAYFSENYDLFCQVIAKLNSDDSAFIEEIKELIIKPNLKNEISFIYANFDCIREAITKLNSNDLSLTQSISILDSVCDRLEENISENDGILIKMRQIFAKNGGLKSLKAVNKILNGCADDNIECELSPTQIAALRWCPITDCEIERSFSRYKFILTDKRLKFEEENLKQYLIIYCNSDII